MIYGDGEGEGDGEQTRDFVYVNDVLKANVLACHHKFYNIVCVKSISLNILAKLIG